MQKMTKTMTMAAAAIAMTLGNGSIAMAQDAPVMSIAYQDLDLSTEAGQAILKQRIDHAVETLCPYNQSSSNVRNYNAFIKWRSECRAMARATGRAQFAALVSKYEKQVRLADATRRR